MRQSIYSLAAGMTELRVFLQGGILKDFTVIELNISDYRGGTWKTDIKYGRSTLTWLSQSEIIHRMLNERGGYHLDK